jgi:hypothetical protein
MSYNEEDFDLRIMSQGVWRRLILPGGEELGGPWEFVADGVIGASPRFVDETGRVIPWHAVQEVHR